MVSISGVLAQEPMATVTGRVVDFDGRPFSSANIKLLGQDKGGTANDSGRFELKVPAGRPFVLVITHVEIEDEVLKKVDSISSGTNVYVVIRAMRGRSLNVINFEGTRDRTSTTIVLEPGKLEIPNVSGDISTYVKTLPGVNSNNELSTQYSVRGGNYDENLVYINGIEIYRPFLNRSGQSEGLSIINTNMVENLGFSAGGFEAYYGDKLSSVLDISYKKPDSFGAIVEGSLLGGNLHLEGLTKNYRLRYLVSGRYRTNKYLLNSLDVQGNYNPVFADIQSYLTYRFNPNTQISLLTYYGSNRYLSIPESQTTKFGTVRDALQIDVFYEGQEITQYQTLLNALLFEMSPRDSLNLSFSATTYSTFENERFDVLGQYFLSQLDNEIGSETFGDPKFTLGVGSYLNHARNFLNANIGNIQHRGDYSFRNHQIGWGAKVQVEQINDKLKEWRYLDSAGYSVPLGAPGSIDLLELVTSTIELSSARYMAYFEDRILLHEPTNAKLYAGIRGNYWTYNGQFLVAPRLNFSIEPNRAFNKRILSQGLPDELLKRNLRFKASLGYYQQPPFYRELRTKSGGLVDGVRAQQSFHAVIGADWNFELWNRDKPFKFSSELYYKHLWDLIPYEIENVRIRYLPEFTAKGYAVGADFHVNGEFIPNIPSWFSFSLMQTREDIDGDTYVDTNGVLVEKGWIARPTDQRYAFNVLFQDFLRNNETYQVHLNLAFAHGLPYGPPGYPQWRNALRVAPYRRVDMGFSKVLFDKSTTRSPSKLLNYTEKVSVSIEVFNLFGIRNTISYLWVKDIFNRQFAVPSYLTSRRFNLQLTVKI